MKKRLLVLFVCLCLLCSLASVGSAAAGDVCFIAVNDNLLELTTMPYFSGGIAYVPYWVFTSYFKIYYQFFSESSSMILYNGDKQLVFDMAGGSVYDGSNTRYSAQAVMRNGTVYVPATFVCSFFGGLTSSFIAGDAYGDIVRIKDSSAGLTDIQFLRAASVPMQSLYEAYKGTGTVTPTATPVPAVSPSPAKESVHEGSRICLGFLGLPDETLLSALARYSAGACFFLTADDVRSDPDLVRRLAGIGYALGIADSGDENARGEAASLLYEAARVKTVLCVSASGGSAAADPDLALWTSDIRSVSGDAQRLRASGILAAIEKRNAPTALLLSCDSVTDGYISTLLNYFYTNNYTVRAPRETDAG